MRIHSFRLRQTPAALTAAALLAIAPAAGAVDGVIEINQAKALAGGVTASDTAGFPVTIDTSGSYRLTSNLALGSSSQGGISITASNVTVDLNGFEIGCDSCASIGGGVGVQSGAGPTNVTVRNGTVRNTGGTAVGLTGTENRVESVRVLGGFNHGIHTGANCYVTGNTVEGAGNLGITTGARCYITDNLVTGGPSLGIDTLGGATIRDNVAVDNGGDGIECTSNCTIIANVAEGNSGDGIDAGNNSLVAHNVSNNNGAIGIDLGQGVAVDNVVTGNTSLGLNGGVNTAYGRNVLSFNNSNGLQVSADPIEVDTNICHGDTTCP